jgi:soluble lytic murein transglycosylase-like protein
MLFPMLILSAALLILVTSLISTSPADGLAVTEPSQQVMVALTADEPRLEVTPVPAIARMQACAVSTAYPAAVYQWCEVITTYAVVEGLDANLVAAIILQESGGNPNALSHSGAVGLMQVMPRDGVAAAFQCKNGPCFANRPSMAELYDPDFNIQYGTHMLAGLLAQHGSLREALRAYGPMDMGYAYADRVLSIYEQYR